MSEEKAPYGNIPDSKEMKLAELINRYGNDSKEHSELKSVAEEMAEKLTQSREIINTIFGELKEDADISAEYFSFMQDFFVGSKKSLEKFNKLKVNEIYKGFKL